MKKISRNQVIKYFLTIKNTYSIHSLSTNISLSMFLLFSSIVTFLLVCFTDVVSLFCRLVQLFGEHLEHSLDGGEGFLRLPQRCPEAVQHTVLGRLPGGPKPQHGLIVVHLSQKRRSKFIKCSSFTFIQCIIILLRFTHCYILHDEKKEI